MRFTIDGKGFDVKALRHDQLTDDMITQWANLETRSVEGNAYLSSDFILPAIKHLTPNRNILFLFITLLAFNAQILTGIGVFEKVLGSRHLPIPHLRAYRCKHSYLSGLLVDEAYAESTLKTFFTFVGKCKPCFFGVEFENKTKDTKFASQIDSAASQLDVSWHQYSQMERAVLKPNKLSSDWVDGILSGKMKKNIRYSRNVLAKSGDIHWNLIKGAEVDQGCIERFLQLEHMGWKGRGGSSLRSTADAEKFFREMIMGRSVRDQVFFTELWINDRIVASTANLLSGKFGFAFKIGWDPEFKSGSPGILNEIEFLEKAAVLLPHIDFIDSGAEQGSFIDTLWRDRYPLESGIFVIKRLAEPVARCFHFARRMKHRFFKTR